MICCQALICRGLLFFFEKNIQNLGINKNIPKYSQSSHSCTWFIFLLIVIRNQSQTKSRKKILKSFIMDAAYKFFIHACEYSASNVG